MTVTLNQLNYSMQRLLEKQSQSIDREERSVVCELFELANRIGEISLPKKISYFQRFCSWVIHLFGKAPNQAKERAYLDATLAHLKGRVYEGYPKHERPSAREMTRKIFHVRRELLAPLQAHFPRSPKLAELDALLLRTRERYGSRIAHEEPEAPRQLPLSTTTQPASITVDLRTWIDFQKRAGYSIHRSESGHITAEKSGREPQIIAPNGRGGYSQLCDFRCGISNMGNHPENPEFAVSWVNGIKTSLTRTIRHAERISSEVRAPVHYLHNPKKGLYGHLDDSRRYLSGWGNSEEVLALTYHLRQLLTESNRDILHICHSQGAALTKLAARHLSAEEKQRIHVLSFGGLLPIEPKDGFASQKNFISEGDRLITTLNSQAARATRGETPEYYRVLPSGGNAKKSHSLSDNSPYHKALRTELEKRSA